MLIYHVIIQLDMVVCRFTKKMRGLYIIGSGHDRHHDSVVIVS